MTVQPNPRIKGVLFPDADSFVLRLPEGRGQVIAVWYDIGTFDMVGEYVDRKFSLADYVLEVNASPADALPVTGWETLRYGQPPVHAAASDRPRRLPLGAHPFPALRGEAVLPL